MGSNFDSFSDYSIPALKNQLVITIQARPPRHWPQCVVRRVGPVACYMPCVPRAMYVACSDLLGESTESTWRMRYWAPTAHHVSGRMPWQVINEGARDCLRDIISSCHGPRTLQRVLELYSGKHNVIRTRAMEGILQMLQAPPLLVLGPLSISHARDSRK